MRANLSPAPCRLSPEPERCPDCGRPAPMRRKGKPLRRCGPCSLASLQARHRAYDAVHQQHKAELRRAGGIPCPPYVAWTVDPSGPGVMIVSMDPAAPDAVVLPAYGACSCGVAGCVHLVVACLATQQGGESNG